MLQKQIHLLKRKLNVYLVKLLALYMSISVGYLKLKSDIRVEFNVHACQLSIVSVQIEQSRVSVWI